jgi:hypothetical protein
MSAPFDEWLRQSRGRTEERLDRQNAPKTPEGRPRDLLERPLGQRAAEPLLERLADFLAGRLEQKPDLPPKWLDSIIFNHRMKPEMLAIMALAPLLNAIDRGHLARRDDDDERGPERALKQKIGGPTAVMIYIRQLAEHCLEYGWVLELLSPTDFPFANRYHKSKVKTVSLPGARRITHRTAVGVTDELKRDKILDAAAANVVHSLDASHLVRSVNAAVDAGITDILTVHDCFYCLAPQVVPFNKIIRSEMTKMYLSYDVLARLRDLNVSDPHNPVLLPVPPYGKLDPLAPQDAEYSFDDERPRRPLAGQNNRATTHILSAKKR